MRVGIRSAFVHPCFSTTWLGAWHIVGVQLKMWWQLPSRHNEERQT